MLHCDVGIELGTRIGDTIRIRRRAGPSYYLHNLSCNPRHSYKMGFFKLLVITLTSLFSLAHSQQFQIQNWGNGNAATNYTYKSLEAGRFTLDWILGAGGNFVAGKGYRGNANLFVSPSFHANPNSQS